MIPDRQAGEPLGRGDAAVKGAGAFGGLGGVLGDVGGDLGVGEVTCGRDRSGVEFAAPGQGATRETRRGGHFDGDGAGGLVDSGGEQRRSGPGGRGGGWSGGAVETDDGVEVDDSATLVLGNLRVGDANLRGKGFVR